MATDTPKLAPAPTVVAGGVPSAPGVAAVAPGAGALAPGAAVAPCAAAAPVAPGVGAAAAVATALAPVKAAAAVATAGSKGLHHRGHAAASAPAATATATPAVTCRAATPSSCASGRSSGGDAATAPACVHVLLLDDVARCCPAGVCGSSGVPMVDEQHGATAPCAVGAVAGACSGGAGSGTGATTAALARVPPAGTGPHDAPAPHWHGAATGSAVVPPVEVPPLAPQGVPVVDGGATCTWVRVVVGSGMRRLKQLVPEHVTYAQLRLVVSHLRRLGVECSGSGGDCTLCGSATGSHGATASGSAGAGGVATQAADPWSGSGSGSGSALGCLPVTAAHPLAAASCKSA